MRLRRRRTFFLYNEAVPTLRENTAYWADRIWRKHQGAIKHLTKCVLALFAIALMLEAFVFNYNYFATRDYQPINLKYKIADQLSEDADGLFRMTAIDNVLEFKNLNTEVHNIRIDFDANQPAQNLDIKIQFTDGAHLTYFDSTEYTVGIPNVTVSTMVSESEYINLNTNGYMNNLRIEIVGDEVSYPIKLWTVTLNMNRPFDFNEGRFMTVFGILLLCFMFRPRSSIYRINIVQNSRRSKTGIVATVLVEMALVTSFLFFGSNLVGVATSDYNSGSWDGRGIVNTFEVGGDNAQQYAELAKAMAHGQLYLDEEPPQWLKDMKDPYDKGARDEAQKATGEPYLFDVAYYEGHYYVYFGVVPVVLFYLPFYLLTGANFPTAIGVLIMALAFILGCSMLLDRFARYHFQRVSLGLYLLLQIPLVACCGILYLVKFPTFYSLPIMCGLAFSVWGLYFWMKGRLSRRPAVWFFAGSLCMALVVGCRPQLVMLSFLAFPLFWRTYITKGRIRTQRGMREVACLLAPYVIVGAAIMLYNHARFGSFTDFGANYNLTMNDMTKRGMNVGRLAPAIFAYFLQPPTVSGTFPFLQPTPFETTYIGQTVKEATFGGIFACLPVLWLLPFAPRILNIRRHARSTRTIMGVIIVLLTAGVVIALADSEMAGILQRYYADFSFMFLAAVVLLVFIVNERLEPDSMARNILMKVLLVLVAVSVAYSTLLCFVPETGWYSDVYPWAYQSVLETFMFWR